MEEYLVEQRRNELVQSLNHRYFLFDPVGSGEQSIVFEAIRKLDSSSAAVKYMSLSSCLDDAEHSRVLERIDAFYKIQCPWVIATHESIITHKRDGIILVMEFFEGESLDAYIRNNEELVTLGHLIGLLRQGAEGLDSLHRSGVIHRDIKPHNFLVSPLSKIMKISDLGLAMTISETTKGTSTHSAGSPAFMAPEQITGIQLTPAADVYSFAMSIYYLLSRKIAFESSDARQLLYAHMNEAPLPLRHWNRSWPIELDRCLSRSLAKNPEERHTTATALVAEVAESLSAFTPLRLSSFFGGSMSNQARREIPVNF